MKAKLIFILVFALFAQIVNGQIFGLKGGANLANATFSSEGTDISPKSILGFHVGPVVDFELTNDLSFNTGLLYSLKGFKMKHGITEILTEESTETFNYLEIPLNIAYKQSLNENVKVFGQVGPYLAYALSAKDKSDGETSDIDFGDGGMKRFDFGLGFGVGLELGRIVPSVSYQLGLANIVDSSDTTIKNRALQFSVAYMFGK